VSADLSAVILATLSDFCHRREEFCAYSWHAAASKEANSADGAAADAAGD
jgi:hypothetical protein